MIQDKNVLLRIGSQFSRSYRIMPNHNLIQYSCAFRMLFKRWDLLESSDDALAKEEHGWKRDEDNGKSNENVD
jgi:hypothetical protein